MIYVVHQSNLKNVARGHKVNFTDQRRSDNPYIASLLFLSVMIINVISGSKASAEPLFTTAEHIVHQAQDHKQTEPDLRLLIVSELMGYIEPCGCTIDLKLGAIDRLDALIRSTRERGPSLLFTVGTHLHDHAEVKPHSLAQEKAKASLVRSVLRDLKIDAHLSGPNDVAAGASFYHQLQLSHPLPELGPSLLDEQTHPRTKLIERGGVSIGVIALSEREPKETLDQVIKDGLIELKQRGASLLIALATISRAQVRTLAVAYPDISLWVLGRGAQEESSLSPVEHSDPNLRTYIVEAGDRGRHLGVVELFGLQKSGALFDPQGERDRELKSLKLKLKMKKRFAKMSVSPMMKRDLETLTTQIKTLESSPLHKMVKRVEYRLIPIDDTLPSSAKVKAELERYQASLTELNMKNASEVKPPPSNGNGYAGIGECKLCHPDAATFWEKTKHASAWETLIKAKKTFDVDCVSCHVTGWQEPGGSALGHTEKLQDVQCEACHGPAAKHAEIGGGESYVKLKVPALVCQTCHNHLHSPKFDYESYRAKVIGPGHGAPITP